MAIARCVIESKKILCTVEVEEAFLALQKVDSTCPKLYFLSDDPNHEQMLVIIDMEHTCFKSSMALSILHGKKLVPPLEHFLVPPLPLC